NGRVYDPLTSQFLSPDPYIQAPDNWLNYNRYSYCYNNPLKYTDPDGELFWAALPLIVKTGIGIGAGVGAYTGYKIGEANGASGLGMAGYMLGGTMIGGFSGYLGVTIAAGGGFMANTGAIMMSSYTNSMGITTLSGGQMTPSISFGVASFNFGTGEFGYLGKKGNSALENIGYGFGALANASDLVSFFSSGGINADLIVEKKDAISHSALVNDSEGINVSVGPYRELGEGIDMDALKSGTGTFKELSRTMKGKIWENHATDGHGWKLPVNNVSKKILSDMSSNLQTKMNNQTLMWNLLGKSCVGYTAKALWSVGVPNLGGIHPYWLQLQMITRQMGIYSSPYLYQLP
ncbi:MAG TPA: RHS repeat-associated core domain-containing protein, partial [Thermoclostridium sp.]|nr:RHS repeat-associated core domain-containing protein [Thermoclostridium sp.]